MAMWEVCTLIPLFFLYFAFVRSHFILFLFLFFFFFFSHHGYPTPFVCVRVCKQCFGVRRTRILVLLREDKCRCVV